MAQPASRSELIAYCKRQLGAPVLEINVADEQIDDLVDDALQVFQERDYDGTTNTFLKYKVTQAAFVFAALSLFYLLYDTLRAHD